MLLTSNIMAILANYFAKVWNEHPSQKALFLALECGAVFMRDCMFNLSHWIFCFKYWLIAVEMEAYLRLMPIGAETLKRNKRLNWVMITLDITMPFLYALCFYFLCVYYPNNVEAPVPPPNSLLTVYLVASYSRGILLLLAAVFLADSMRRIHDAITSVDLNLQMN